MNSMIPNEVFPDENELVELQLQNSPLQEIILPGEQDNSPPEIFINAPIHEITLDETQMCFFEGLGDLSEVADDVAASEIMTASDSTSLETSLSSREEVPTAPAVVADSSSLSSVLCDSELINELAGIPQRLAFKIGDVADLLGIKQYVLRYWETEFEVLRPRKAQNNQRMYSRKDVENAFLIRKLLHRDRFSIEGARNALKDLRTHARKEVQKDKVLTQAVHKFDTVSASLQSLLADIHKLKSVFR